MNQIPDDVECVSLGSGCPNNCWYCHESTEVEFKGASFTKQKVKLNDMNILAYPEPYKLLTRLGESKRYFELVCGVDWRRMDLPTACLLRKYRFGRFNKKGKWSRYIRFAWDGKQNLQYKMLDTKKLLLSAGFKPNQIGIFMLVNGKDCSIEECRNKLNTINTWNCQVNDCCFDGGYPKDIEDYRENYLKYWTYKEIVQFRSECRKHDQKINRDGIDPELRNCTISDKESS